MPVVDTRLQFVQAPQIGEFFVFRCPEVDEPVSTVEAQESQSSSPPQ